jgi:pumilio RNA-binding family
MSKLQGQMLQMARHKFASNVCEKALVTADPENRRILIDEIMALKPDGVSPIVTMMKDQFASKCLFSLCSLHFPDSLIDYVLQRALAVVDGEQKEALISKIRPQLMSMRRYSSAYSKHLISSTSSFKARKRHYSNKLIVERLLEKYPSLSQLEHAHELSIMPPELIP